MKTSNDLKVTKAGTFKNGTQYEVKIRLSDECKNGHEDFSITGTTWEKGKSKTDRNMISGGAMGDTFAEELGGIYALFNDLHLCDFNGVPMHCTANMYFHLREGKFPRGTAETFRDEFCEYYRITAEQFDVLNGAKEKEHFIALFLQMPEILENWKGQAQKAIKYLEGETGIKFESKATKSNLILPSAEELQKIEAQRESGYFLPEVAEARAKTKEQERRAKKIAQKKEDAKKKKQGIEQDLYLDCLLIDNFGTDQNVIYYKHSNNIVFNWQDSPYNKNWSESEFSTFCGLLDKSKFDKDLKISFGK